MPGCSASVQRAISAPSASIAQQPSSRTALNAKPRTPSSSSTTSTFRSVDLSRAARAHPVRGGEPLRCGAGKASPSCRPTLAVELDVAPRLLDEAVHLAEAQPGAFADALGREERIERPRHHLLVHAGARVGDRRPSHTGRASPRCSRRHRPDRAWHSPSRWSACRRPAMASRALTARLRIALSSCGRSTKAGHSPPPSTVSTAMPSPRVRRSISDMSVTHRLTSVAVVERLQPGEGQQALGQRGGAARAGQGVLGHGARPRVLAREPARKHVQIADDDRQHVVEVVRDAARELSQRLHLLRLAELPLGSLALRDLAAERIVRGSEFARASSVGPDDEPSEGSSEQQGNDDDRRQDCSAECGSVGACDLEFHLRPVELGDGRSDAPRQVASLVGAKDGERSSLVSCLHALDRSSQFSDLPVDDGSELIQPGLLCCVVPCECSQLSLGRRQPRRAAVKGSR